MILFSLTPLFYCLMFDFAGLSICLYPYPSLCLNNSLNFLGGCIGLKGIFILFFWFFTLTSPDINSRFVCKGPIHKLVNQLATRFECCDQGKPVSSSQNRKRSRPQTYPAFILNISCPRSFYDLTFEPSKTYVEFKVILFSTWS